MSFTFQIKSPPIILVAAFICFLTGSSSSRSEVPQDEIKRALLSEYTQDPMIRKLISGDPKVKAEVTALKEISPGQYQAVLELGREMQNGTLSFSYFGNFTKIFSVDDDKKEIRVSDVTTKDLPTQKLWAHYKVTTGTVEVAANPEKLSSATVKGVKFYYIASSAAKSDVFIPVDDPKLKLKFRLLLLNPNGPSMFIISPNGQISLGQVMTEESDGPLSFALKGAGRTGWSPWNHEFLGMVTGVEKKKASSVADANPLLLPSFKGACVRSSLEKQLSP